MIKPSELKEVLHYCPDTGVFTWLKSLSNRAAKGKEAGCLSKSSGYVVLRINNKLYLAHRLAWLYVYGAFPEHKIDHINGIRDDNKISNLRDVSDEDNARNVSKPVSNRSGVVGLSRIKSTGKWRASINHNNKGINLGHFDDFFEACCARKSAENRLGYHPNHGRNNAT